MLIAPVRKVHTMTAEDKGMLNQAKDEATKVAKKGAKEVKSVATEALAAAATAAAAAAGGVVLNRISDVLDKGQGKVEDGKQAVQRALPEEETASVPVKK